MTRIRQHPALGLLLAAALLAAAAPAAGQTPTVPLVDPPPVVRDIAQITLGEPRVDLDPSGTAATIRVTTSIEMACSVVFGEDDRFGRIAVDSDMAGGGHTDHGPLLAGLEPGTTYLYRLQGAGPDGTLYQGRILSFRTPDAPAADPGNLALGATIVAVSSEFSAAFGAANAIDGSPATEWSSAGDGDDAFITLDLGTPHDIGAVGWDSRSMTDGTAITATFTLTADGVEVGTFPAGPAPVEVSLTAQVLRFDVASSTGGNTGAREIVVRGPVSAQDAQEGSD